MNSFISRMVGLDSSATIESVELRFAAPWAEGRPVLVILACIAAIILAVYFYYKLHAEAGLVKRPKRRFFLSVLRSILMVIVVLVLAEPVIWVAYTQNHKPQLLVLLDGSGSMNTRDELPNEQVTEMRTLLTAPESGESPDPTTLTRAELVRLAMQAGPLADTLDEIKEDFDLRFYLMDSLDQARLLETESEEEETPASKDFAELLTFDAEITALGGALDDLALRHGSQRIGGTIIVSDFIQNAGVPALDSIGRLNSEVFAIGLGPVDAVDLQVQLEAPLVLKQDELTAVTATIKQQGLDGQVVQIQLFARPLGDAGAEEEQVPIGTPVAATLDQPTVTVPIPLQPDESGRFELIATIEPVAGEVNTDNNSGRREVNIKDDSLKLYFVEYEPTWEWRFVKEVFHRDPLIGQDGFRTFLRSADFKVRQTNDLFVDQLVRPRREFFSNDVILLSDVPAEMMTKAFQDLLIEYVEEFGGGLVVIAGPRFGLSSLARTRIGEMLPVVLDPTIKPKAGEFALNLSPIISEYPFMQLGGSDAENNLAWNNIGPLPWYQPVLRAHPLATVLATHPRDRAVDNESLQPLIASRRYGKGEVIYLGFNETWRLRRKYGERFYRQFWGQLIYRLGLGRVLGEQKRFSPTTDRSSYRTGDLVRFTVEAYNADFEPLENELLSGQLYMVNEAGQETFLQDIVLPLTRDNHVFEATTMVYEPGRYRLLIDDPIANEKFELGFEVTSTSRENEQIIRNVGLQTQLASQTGGKKGELYELPEILRSIEAKDTEEPAEQQLPLWNTWLVLLILLLLMHTEWLARKLFNLR